MSTKRNQPSHPDLDPDRTDEHWLDPDHEYVIYRSTVPVTVDGFKLQEPYQLVCLGCWTSTVLTESPSTSIDELEHDPECPYLH